MKHKVSFLIVLIALVSLVSCSKAPSKSDAFYAACSFVEQQTAVSEMCPYEESRVKELAVANGFEVTGWYKDYRKLMHSFKVAISKDDKGDWRVGYHYY